MEYDTAQQLLRRESEDSPHHDLSGKWSVSFCYLSRDG